MKYQNNTQRNTSVHMFAQITKAVLRFLQAPATKAVV